jgi:hypothetical protein
MAYTDIDNPELHFQTVLYTGNATARSITLDGSEDMQPDWVWCKNRDISANNHLFDSVRGATKDIISNATTAEATDAQKVTSFNSDGFSLGTNGNVNGNGNQQVAWNWKAGGTAPTQTYIVKVVSDSGNKYRFDDFGASAVTLDLQEGGTYTFDQSDSSNATHPLRFYTASDKSGGEYTTGVTTTGTPGNAGAKTVITVAASAPTLYYQCSSHSAMGGQANTNSTFGSSNFSGTIQSKVSANSTGGFSIVSYTGNATSGATVGHGLGAVPGMIMIKNRDDGSTNWSLFHKSLTGTTAAFPDLQNVPDTNSKYFNNTNPTSSVFSLGNYNDANGNSNGHIAYCFAEKKGYTKFGTYTGNGNASGAFITTGFLPAWIMVKPVNATQNWQIHDLKRLGYNVTNKNLSSNNSAAEAENDFMDILSNGFKIRRADVLNVSGDTYIYMAFAESPFVNSKGVPNNAR